MDSDGDIVRFATLLDEEWMTTEPQLHLFDSAGRDAGADPVTRPNDNKRLRPLM